MNPTVTLIWRLLSWRPWLTLANMTIWTLDKLVPLGLAWVIQQYFDELRTPTAAGFNISTLLAFLAVLVVLKLSAYIGGHWTWFDQELNGCALLRRNMLDWLTRSPHARHLPYTSGEAIDRFREDVRGALLYVEFVIFTVGPLLFAVVALYMMVQIEPLITGLVLLPIITIIWITSALTERIKTLRKAVRVATGQVASHIGEMFDHVHIIELASAEDAMVKELEKRNETRRKAIVRDVVFHEALQSLNQNLVNIGVGIILVIAGQQIRDGSFSVGDFALFLTLLNPLTQAMQRIGDLLAQHRRTVVSSDRLRQLMGGSVEALAAPHELHTTGDIPVVERPVPTQGTLQSLAVEGLEVSLGGTQVLKDVGFHLEPGELLVITGKIGSGKTTLLRSLLGLQDLDAGRVLLNGDVLPVPATRLVPPLCSYTPQVPRLFSESMRHNIEFGPPSSDERLARAAHLAVLEPDIASLEEGLDTLIGPRGVKLSGGQNLRTAAARMFHTESELLVFDDLSSALDVETESELWRRVFKQDGVTCLAVSHRKPVLERADRILVLEAGRVVASGTKDELLRSSSAFRELWQGGATG